MDGVVQGQLGALGTLDGLTVQGSGPGVVLGPGGDLDSSAVLVAQGVQGVL